MDVEFHKKLDKVSDSVIRLEGQVDTLTKLLGHNQAQVSKVEGRLWGTIIMSAGAMAGAILSFLMGKK